MSPLGEHVELYRGEQESVRADHDLPHGVVCVRSIRAPDKETPNEDAAAVIQVGADSLVLAVADGVGGTPAGREASSATVETLRRVLAERAHAHDGQLRPVILDAVEAANKAVLEIARGAATTLVVAELVATRLRSYHVGDSELVTVGQRGRVKARVVPHSPTGFAVEAGLLDEDEAVQHDQRHVIFNVLGTQDMRVEVGPALQLAARDTVLLASDGLFDNLYFDEIVDIIRTGPLPDAADRLVAKARGRMAGNGANGAPCKPDDLTVVLFRPRAVKQKQP
jgi:serine/threonine protein phosphatase PrpC